MSLNIQDPGKGLVDIIKNYVAEAPENSLGLPTGEKAFDSPLVGFSSGADSLYPEFRNHIGSLSSVVWSILKRR